MFVSLQIAQFAPSLHSLGFNLRHFLTHKKQWISGHKQMELLTSPPYLLPSHHFNAANIKSLQDDQVEDEYFRRSTFLSKSFILDIDIVEN